MKIKLMVVTPEKPILGIDVRLINMSGIGTVCQNTIPFFLKDFKVILLGDPVEINKYDWAAACQIIPFFSKIYSIKEQLSLFLKVPECEYFLSPHYNIPLLPIKAKERITIIHDVNHIALNTSYSLAQKLYAKFVIDKALQLSDKVITVSDFSKTEIIKFFSFNSKKLFKITLGVDKTFYHKLQLNLVSFLINRYQLPEKFILYVGNVKPHKNLSVLIKAYNHLKIKNSIGIYKLVIVGRREGFITKENSILKLISDLGLIDDIIFTGFVENSDLPKIYNLATLFVFPSLYEGFGLPPIEAMACGCPVLVSNTSSLPEVCGDAAIYFNPLDDVELSEKISNILNNGALQEELITNGLKHVEKYNWQITAEEIKTIIRL